MREHDAIFKRAFRIPKNAAGELAAVLPKEVLDAIDLRTLTLVEGDELVDGRLDTHFRDALFRTRFRGLYGDVPGYVWFLVEHQSGPDKLMVFRVLEYLVHSWSQLLRLEPERKTLPPMLGVIVHHGEGGWTAPIRLHDIVEGIDQAPVLRTLVPDFLLIVDDLVKQPDEALKRRELASFPKAVLWALRDARTTQRFYEHLVAWADVLGELVRESPEDAATLMRYILSVAGNESFENIKQHILELVPTTEDVMATAAEQLIQRGKTEGKIEGKAEGKIEGKAEDIFAVLEARGLSPTAEQRTQILDCRDIAELDRWLRRAATAPSVAELFSH